MDNYEQVTISVVKKVTKVIFNDIDRRNKIFAKKFVVSYDSKIAYDAAFEDIQQVRASTILQSPELWEYIFKEMKMKRIKTPEEMKQIESYDSISENFGLTPFKIYRIFVEKTNKAGDTLGNILNIDCCQAFSYLLYAFAFFKLLKREYFIKGIKDCITKECDMIEMTGRGLEKQSIIKSAQKQGVYFDDVYE